MFIRKSLLPLAQLYICLLAILGKLLVLCGSHLVAHCNLLGHSLLQCFRKSHILQRVLVVEAWHHRSELQFIYIVPLEFVHLHLDFIHAFLGARHVRLHRDQLFVMNLLVERLLITKLALSLLLVETVLNIGP